MLKMLNDDEEHAGKDEEHAGKDDAGQEAAGHCGKDEAWLMAYWKGKKRFE